MTKAKAPRLAEDSVAVKICGIREAGTLRAMRGLPVDFVGFVLAPSRRRVTPEEAGALVAAARDIPMADGRPPRTVGVFVNPTLAELERTLRVAPFDIVQLHGAETPEFCREVARRFGVEVWRALAAGDGEAVSRGGTERAPSGAGRTVPGLDVYHGAVTAVLLDTAGGGTGRTFRWDVLPACREAARRNGLALIVAGGLTPDNVRALIDAYRPDGVDVSSGVETDGRKDVAKIAAFVERVKRT